ncbi:M28 family peptidase [Leptolyngbya sp. FACHB-17]|uniref:M28 family peptidase n=1 Tax=unclassified Leptolyngbya TaxID=2650499 RepID=UPI001680C474|nr:M28 family peptidase [Leptolyngbya sp. FACHB-17]MBD2080063.1 M28 family peptidase [Leptolyngbya sp. FACHB-17]
MFYWLHRTRRVVRAWHIWLGGAIALCLIATHALVAADLLYADVQALVKIGARAAGSSRAEQASEYLITEYRKAGYQVEIQTFTYPKFADVGSSLIADGKTIGAWALVRSVAGNVTGQLVAVPNFGRAEDFKAVNVRNRIAIVQRGGNLQFAEKIENAAAAGALGILIVNNQLGNTRGMLLKASAIPAASLSQEVGTSLLQQAQGTSILATLRVKAQPSAIGRNVIAHLPDIKQPQLIIGGHYDSVEYSPGANDNASGTAVVLGLARSLSKSPQARQIWFVSFDGEEDGLKGSEAFVDRATSQFLARLKAMLNFDMVGINDRLLLEGSGAMSEIASSINGTVSSNQLGGSDHLSFKAKNVPTLFFFRGKDPNYHSPGDTLVEPRLLRETQATALKIISTILNQASPR